MFLPKTPKTIISQLVDPESGSLWNLTWRRFFDLYHAPIKIMIGNSFFKRGIYSIPGSVIDEIVSDVVISLNKIFTANLYDSEKSRFRSYLKTVCDRRVIDYLRRNVETFKTDSLDNEDFNVKAMAESIALESENAKLAEEEQRAFKESVVLDAYMSIRHKFDARTCTAFEMIKLEDVEVEKVVEELGVSPNVVNNAVYRITKKLREVISEDPNLKGLFDEGK